MERYYSSSSSDSEDEEPPRRRRIFRERINFHFWSEWLISVYRDRYTYGKPVKGELVISAYPTIHSTYIQPVFSGVSRKTVRIDGLADVEFDLTKELGLTDDYQRIVQVEAMVTERLTGRQQNATKAITLHKYDYKLEVIRGAESFKPGLPYSITVKVATQDDVPVSDPNPKALLVKHGFSYNHDEFNSSYHSIPPNGLVTLTFIAPPDEEKYVLGIEATYKELTEWFPTVQKALSVTNAYLEVDIKTENPKVNGEIEVEVHTTVPLDTLYYVLIGRGDILLSRKFTLRAPSQQLSFRLLASANSAPESTLVIYAVYQEEIIADSVTLRVDGSLDNFLNITMTAEEAQPGQDVNIVVGSRPNSLIGLRGIDQSVLVLSKEDRDINLGMVERELESWSTGVGSTRSGNFAFGRYKRSLLYHSTSAITASQVFENAGVVVMTNSVVHQQPPLDTWSRNGRVLDTEYLYDVADGEINFENRYDSDARTKNDRISSKYILADGDAFARKRKYFPETWLWEMISVR